MATKPHSGRLERLTDPRLGMEEGALVLASRNGFPIVATRRARKDGAGLAVGAAGALLLGGVTFLSMSGGRERAPEPDLPRPAVAKAGTAAPRPAPLPMVPTAAPAQDGTSVTLPLEKVPPVSLMPDRLHAPVMVLDTSMPPGRTGGAESPPVQPGSPALPSSQQGLTDNEAFGERMSGSGIPTASAARMVDPANTVTQGTLIPAILETAIDSDLPGYVRAVVSQNVLSFDGHHVLIPRSSRLVGQYKSGLSAGQTRAYVMWTRLIRPDGASVELASPAVDFAGRSGLTGEVNGHFMKRFGSAMLLSVIGGLGAITGGTSVVLSSGQSASSVAVQRDSTISPTIRVRPGQPIRVFTARDLDFASVAPVREVVR